MNQTPANDIYNKNVLDILIESNYKKVIEIGCMHGALAKKFREYNDKVIWYGIDIDASYAEESAKYCTKTFSADIEKLSSIEMNFFSDADAWIFADVLEHLYDPWSLLNKISKNGNGVELITCIPNAQHWSFQARLNAGDFKYEDSGLFDRTHIRFFTIKTMVEMFNRSGFRILKIIPRIYNFPNQNIYDECIYKMAEISGIDANEAVKNSKVFQYVFHLKSGY